MEEEAEKKIRITGTLIRKLLSGEAVEIYNGFGPLHELMDEDARDRVFAEIVKEKEVRDISIYYEKYNDGELTDTNEVYRLPYSTNRKWLRTALKNAQEQWHTSMWCSRP